MAFLAALWGTISVAFGSVTGIIKLASALVTFIQWVNHEISDLEFQKAMSDIKAGVAKAQTGTLPEREQGGADVQNNFNKHV